MSILRRHRAAGIGLAIGMALCAAPVWAQGAAERLSQVLGRVPAAAMEAGSGPIVAGYGDGDAIRWIAVRGAQAGLNPNTPNRIAVLRSAPPNQRAVFEAHSDTEIRAALALMPSDWLNTWEVSRGAARVGEMDIIPDSEMRLRGALFVRGFEEETRGAGTVMWSGSEDFLPDPGAVDSANPFGGDEGLPLRISFSGNRALWATGWDLLDRVEAGGSGESLAQAPQAQAVIAGLRQVPNLGPLVSVRAWFGAAEELPIVGDPAPPVAGLALADYARRESEGAAMVIVLSDTVDAPAMAARLSAAWPILSALPSPAEPQISAVGQALVVSMGADWGADGAATNGAYVLFEDMLAGGRLAALLNR